MTGELIVYQTDDGAIRLETRLENETLWMTQSQMAELFQTTVANINIHIKNILDDGELSESATIKDFLIVRLEGGRDVQRNIAHYNLDMVISVGYRVKSVIATRFRIWATQRLKEYIVKGFVVDDERLKNPPVAGKAAPDYFDELLNRIRDIRASERRMYLRVREIFSMAADYTPSLAETTQFFSIIQNKLHFAVTGLTAAEVIHQRADHTLPSMGITTKSADEIRKSDVTVAKNYFSETEIDALNRIVVMWLDFAEDQASRRKQVFMQDWQIKLDDFLRFNDRDVLPNAGKVSKKQADNKAHIEYEQFAQERRVQKEALGEAEMMRALEVISKRAKNNPDKNNKGKP